MIIDFIPSLTAAIYLVGVLTYVFKNNPRPWRIFIDTYNVYSDIPRWISVTVYTFLAYKLAVKHKNAWLKQFTVAFLAFAGIWLLFLIPYTLPQYSNHLLDAVDWYPLYIPLAAMVYWLGIKGYIISYQTSQSVKKERGLSNTLTDAAVGHIVAKLTRAMEEEKLYLNPELSLQRLSQHMGLQQKIVSSVLNQHMHKSFNAFVNEYRIAAFKQKLQQADMDNLTMAGIAAECGFISQATFQRTFKEITGMSPGEYRKMSSQIRI